MYVKVSVVVSCCILTSVDGGVGINGLKGLKLGHGQFEMEPQLLRLYLKLIQHKLHKTMHLMQKSIPCILQGSAVQVHFIGD